MRRSPGRYTLSRMLLPDPHDAGRLRPEFPIWFDALRIIASRHGGGDVRPCAGGSNVVAYLGTDRIIKLLAPQFAVELDRERIMLAACAEGGVVAPGIVGDGELEGWPYLVLSRLPGRPLDEVWPNLSRRARERLVEDLAHTLGRVHRLRPEGLDTDWSGFEAGLRATWNEKHRNRGPADSRADEAEGWRERALPQESSVVLHADLTDDNALCDEEGRLTGLIDFADARWGPRGYEVAAPIILLTKDDFALGRRFCDALPGPRLQGEDIVMFCLLHQFSPVGRFPAGGLDELAERWEPEGP